MLALLDLLQNRLPLAADSLPRRPAEDPCDFVGTQTQQLRLATTPENLVNREAAAEDEIAAVLALIDRAVAAQRSCLAVFGRELRSHDEGPVVELFLNLLRVEAVGGGLQLAGVGATEKAVVVLAIAHAAACELSFDEVMTVEVIRGVKGQQRGHAQHECSQLFAANAAVVVRQAAALSVEDTVVGIAGGILGRGGAKACAGFHALEDEVETPKRFWSSMRRKARRV